MANNCGYNLKVVGRKEDCDRLLRIMGYEDDNDYYLYRIFDADSYESGEENGKFYHKIYGECAWSVNSCMFENGYHSYYTDEPNHMGTTISNLCKLLNVDVEIYSEECGCQFAEHYIINNKGEVTLEDTVPYIEIWCDDENDMTKNKAIDIVKHSLYDWEDEYDERLMNFEECDFTNFDDGNLRIGGIVRYGGHDETFNI